MSIRSCKSVLYSGVTRSSSASGGSGLFYFCRDSGSGIAALAAHVCFRILHAAGYKFSLVSVGLPNAFCPPFSTPPS